MPINDYKVIIMVPKIIRVSANNELEVSSIIRNRIKEFGEEPGAILYSIEELKKSKVIS